MATTQIREIVYNARLWRPRHKTCGVKLRNVAGATGSDASAQDYAHVLASTAMPGAEGDRLRRLENHSSITTWEFGSILTSQDQRNGVSRQGSLQARNGSRAIGKNKRLDYG